MNDVIGILQNDPNRGLRDRLDPEERASARDSLTLVLSDLHEAARTRLEAPEATSRRHRRRH
jgi:hypothetical protein